MGGPLPNQDWRDLPWQAIPHRPAGRAFSTLAEDFPSGQSVGISGRNAIKRGNFRSEEPFLGGAFWGHFGPAAALRRHVGRALLDRQGCLWPFASSVWPSFDGQEAPWLPEGQGMPFTGRAWPPPQKLERPLAEARPFTKKIALGALVSGSFARGRCRRGRSEIPHFCSKLLLVALVLLGEAEKSEEKGGKCVKKGEKCEEKGGKCVKIGENHSDPIYTNPIKNLPVVAPSRVKMEDQKMSNASFQAIICADGLCRRVWLWKPNLGANVKRLCVLSGNSKQGLPCE